MTARIGLIGDVRTPGRADVVELHVVGRDTGHLGQGVGDRVDLVGSQVNLAGASTLTVRWWVRVLVRMTMVAWPKPGHGRADDASAPRRPTRSTAPPTRCRP